MKKIHYNILLAILGAFLLVLLIFFFYFGIHDEIFDFSKYSKDQVNTHENSIFNFKDAVIAYSILNPYVIPSIILGVSIIIGFLVLSYSIKKKK